MHHTIIDNTSILRNKHTLIPIHYERNSMELLIKIKQQSIITIKIVLFKRYHFIK